MNKIRMAGGHYETLRNHLFPGDGKEAVAVALCGRYSYGNTEALIVQEIHPVPYDVCYERRSDFVHWPTDWLNPLIEKASRQGLAIIKFHSHPGYYEKFSELDNESDTELFSFIHAWLDDGKFHASCIMLPDGRIFGRFFDDKIEPKPVEQILVAGSDILCWHYRNKPELAEELQVRNLQAFGRKTIEMLKLIKIGVVGCSGTGSPTIEQLKRFGVGELVLVDPDFVDKLNLNRILNSTLEDAKHKVLKVDVMKRSIDEVGFQSCTKLFAKHISDYEIIKELADCDFIFGCVDSAEGRHIINLISSYYVIPVIDMGVKLVADGKGGIDGIFGSVHYIQPGGSSLLNRGQYNTEDLRAEGIKRANREEYDRNQYLAEVNENSPAVISVNMQVSATAVNEFLARIHPYRNQENSEIDIVRIMYSDCVTYSEKFNTPCPYFSKLTGKGDIHPLLNNPEFTQR